MTTHTLYQCPPGCDKAHCPYCHGGLALCTVCGGAEGSMPTECPGVRMPSTTADAVYAGKLDYKHGQWQVTFDPVAEARRVLMENGL